MPHGHKWDILGQWDRANDINELAVPLVIGDTGTYWDSALVVVSTPASRGALTCETCLPQARSGSVLFVLCPTPARLVDNARQNLIH